MFEPKYLITSSLLKSISQIEAARAVIDNSPLLPLYQRKFKAEATARKVHFSTAIEGNYLNLNEVERVLAPSLESVDGFLAKVNSEGDDVIARKRDIYEVINYRDAVDFIEKTVRGDNKFILQDGIIREMHKVLMKNILLDSLGSYRSKRALTVNFATGEKFYPYEDVGNITGRMKDLIEWYNSTSSKEVHPIIKSGVLHIEIVRIHPFEEGNGRLARSLSTLALSAEGYDVNHFFCLDEYYDSDAKEYYQSLSDGFKNLGVWLEYFATGMSIEFNRVKERVLKISKDAKIKEKSGQVFITERQEKIVEWINNFGFFRNQDFDELFADVSEDTVLRELKGLIDEDIIIKKGKTKSARYEVR